MTTRHSTTRHRPSLRLGLLALLVFGTVTTASRAAVPLASLEPLQPSPAFPDLGTLRALPDTGARHGFLYCGCGSSGEAFPSNATRSLSAGLLRARQLVRAAARNSTEQKFAAAAGALGEAMAGCARAHGLGACVAADAAGPKVYCTVDKASGDALGRTGGFLAKAPLCKADKATAGKPVGSEEPVASGAPVTVSPSASPGDLKVSEGCVAVEHLRGAVLQHRAHLRRRVLCGRGFCATPNHAIEVDGVQTSMRELCAPDGAWTCVPSVRMVNNIKVKVHAWWEVRPGLVVTPHDARFPRVATLISQTLEDLKDFFFFGERYAAASCKTF